MMSTSPSDKVNGEKTPTNTTNQVQGEMTLQNSHSSENSPKEMDNEKLSTNQTQEGDYSKFTKRKTPWSRVSTDFNEIVHYDYKGSGTKEDPFQVIWIKDDPENPLNMPHMHKWILAGFVSVATLAVALASSAYSGALDSIKTELGGSTIVITLGVSLFVLGFALGPLIWAPLSELLGRRNLFLFTYTFLTIWLSVAAASQTLAQLLVFRFLAGAFGSSPLANAGGTIADVFSAKERGLAMALFASAPFLGPSLGPICGGFLGESAGFRWVQGFLGIFSGVVLFLGIFMYTETYAPFLLRKRAEKLQKATGKHYISQLDAGKGDVSFTKQFMTSLGRPWLLLAFEPIVLLLSLYTAVVYAILYSFFSAFPIVFQQVRGWSPGIGGLAFLGILVGMIFAFALVIFYINPDYIKEVEKNGGLFAPPEVRLKGALIGAPLLVVGLAAFAATDFPSIHWSAPIILSSPFGFAMVLIFLSLQNYLIDAYLLYAASVLAANSVVRSVLGAAFPLFTPYMYHPGGASGNCPTASCGIHVGPAIGGAIALLFLPAPFLFYKRGEQIRKKCKYAAEADKLLQRMLAAGKEQEGKQQHEEEEEEENDSNDNSTAAAAHNNSDLENQRKENRSKTVDLAMQQEQQKDEYLMQSDDVNQPADQITKTHAKRSNNRTKRSENGYEDGEQLSMQYSHHSVY